MLPQESVWHKEISIHALREEGDPQRRRTSSASIRFLSTPSARRATAARDRFRPVFRISIHALREEGDGQHGSAVRDHNISIHALREEGDLYTGIHLVVLFIFLSTPSARRATTARPMIKPCSVFLSTPSARRATYALLSCL